MILFLSSIMSSFADEDSRPKLLILGDSLSAGYRLSNEVSWPVLLNNLIGEKTQSSNSSKLNIQIINASISGDTAEQGLARLPNLLETYKPNYILIELGANNGLQGLDTNNLKTTLKSIISDSKAAGAEPILMQIDIPRNYGKRYVDAFSAVYPSIAAELNIPLIPFFMESVVINNAQNGGLWLQDDGIHPTEAAQPFIANWMYDTLISTLKPKE
ncbi:GDSL-type esterase/lipase family protein [Thorsellia anophelis]|nr:GDSL-type esterase/lipase family protein [Thorsellia anophelis]